LNAAAARAWSARWATLAFATVLTLAVLVVDAQPVRSAWWTYADADATYTASALNLMLGEEVTFVDHPGLPITEAVAVATGLDALLEEGTLSQEARRRYVDRTLLDLDRVRAIFRGFAISFYLAGAVLAFLLARRLFGHWTWGLANGLLWLAAPGLIPMSIQLRPDVLLAVLCLVFGFAVAQAAERRSPMWFAGAAALVGLATMVKLHALALLPALVVAAAWRPPAAGAIEAAVGSARAAISARRATFGTLAAAWLALAVLLNWERFPFSPTASQLRVTATVLAVAALALALGIAVRRPLVRLGSLLVASFVGGVLVPVTFDVQDGMRALVYVVRNVSGQGVQENVEPFATPLSFLDDLVGRPVVVFLAIAALAGVVGAFRREPVPVVWATGALFAAAFAYARPPNVHYFAPAFVLSALAVLWLVRRESRVRVPLLAWIVVLYVLMPAWDGRAAAATEQQRLADVVEPAKAYVGGRIGPGEVALVPSYWPFADARYFELVQIYVAYTPPYPYRYLPATAAARPFAQLHTLRPRYFVGPQAVGLTGATRMQLGDIGEYTVAPVEGLVAELVGGPGVDEPW
jgi:hypothetical protein